MVCTITVMRKINFGSVEFSYDDIDANEERLKKITNLVLKFLDEKLSEWAKDKDDDNDGGGIIECDNKINNKSSLFSSANELSNMTTNSSIAIDKITIPSISVDM